MEMNMPPEGLATFQQLKSIFLPLFG